jgi:hypothetical protein
MKKFFKPISVSTPDVGTEDKFKCFDRNLSIRKLEDSNKKPKSKPKMGRPPKSTQTTIAPPSQSQSLGTALSMAIILENIFLKK